MGLLIVMPLAPLVCDPECPYDHSLLRTFVVGGLRAEDSVTGQGRLRLLPVEEASSISSEFCSAELSRSRERKAENMVGP